MAVGSYPRDDNRVPITQLGVVVSDVTTFSTTGTVIVPIFHITGTVMVNALWGEVTTTLGSNVTAAYWRLNDQTAQANITLNTGTTLSSKTAGSVIVKKGLAAAALVLLDNAAGVVSEPTTLETLYFSPFVVTKKTAAVTDIEFCYTTNNTSLGVIKFYAGYTPISGDGSLAST